MQVPHGPLSFSLSLPLHLSLFLSLSLSLSLTLSLFLHLPLSLSLSLSQKEKKHYDNKGVLATEAAEDEHTGLVGASVRLSVYLSVCMFVWKMIHNGILPDRVPQWKRKKLSHGAKDSQAQRPPICFVQCLHRSAWLTACLMFEVIMLLYTSLEFEIRNEHYISLVMTLTYRL